MSFRQAFILCGILLFTCSSAYAHYWFGTCDYQRAFQIVPLLQDPTHPITNLKIMSSLSDDMGTGFAYFGDTSSKDKTSVVANCWDADFFEGYHIVTRNGDESNGMVHFIVGSSSDPKDQLEILVSIHRPFFGSFKTSVVPFPSVASNYRLMSVMKNVSGDTGTLPLIIAHV